MNFTQQTDEEYLLPHVEALLAGTLALMTGLVQSQCVDGDSLYSSNIKAMQSKVLDNLNELCTQSAISPNLRLFLLKLVNNWQEINKNNAENVNTQIASLKQNYTLQ